MAAKRKKPSSQDPKNKPADKPQPAEEQVDGTLRAESVDSTSEQPTPQETPFLPPVNDTLLPPEIQELPATPANESVAEVFGAMSKQASSPPTGSEDASDTWILDSDSLRLTNQRDLESSARLQAAISADGLDRTWKVVEPMPGDSVFELVARRGLVTDSAVKISDSQGADRQSVAQCINEACKGVDKETADYELLEFLGQGGMGIVLKAHQKAIGRDVALKMMFAGRKGSSGTAGQQGREFFYEPQITGKLDHPNIVPVYELGVSNDVYFYSMKYIVGPTWKDLFAEQSRDEKLTVWMKVADAIAFAHQKNIVHLDLKPENTMVGDFGEVLVTDWGCAIDLTKRAKKYRGGSPMWMPPEMARGQADRMGKHNDIYLLGAILYQIIAGHPPHPGRSVEDCKRAAQANAIWRVDTKDPLMDIALRAMKTEPRERYASVEALQDAVHEYQQHNESIRLSTTSHERLESAIRAADYRQFSNAIFGFEEALEKWPENEAAHSGLTDARIAYGECAYQRNAFDLCMQTLEQLPEGKQLYDKAEAAKKVEEQRKTRLRNLRRTFVAVVSTAAVVMAALLAVLWSKNITVARLTQDASDLVAVADKAKSEAAEAEKKIIEAEGKVVDANSKLVDAQVKLSDAGKSLSEAETKLSDRETKLADAETKLDDANENLEKANMDVKEAEQDKVNAEKEVVQLEAKTTFGDYDFALKDALQLVKETSPVKAIERLAIRDSGVKQDAFAFAKRQPKFESWPRERVELLSNRELLRENLGGDVTGVVFAERRNIGAVALQTQNGAGSLQLVRLDDKGLGKYGEPQETAMKVDGLAISPDGDELIFSLADRGSSSTVYSWKLDGASDPVAVASTEKRWMQRFAISDRQVVGGINGGVWVWKRNHAQWPNDSARQIKNIRGLLKTLQLIDERYALALVELDEIGVYYVDLESEIAPIKVTFDPTSDFKTKDLSSIAFARGRLILGTQDGSMFTATSSPGMAEIGSILELPKQHTSTIQSIKSNPDDGTLLTIASEPAVHIWKPINGGAGWRYDTFLAGTPGNVGAACFMTNSSLVLGVDVTGVPIVWDVERQKQRRQLVPLAMDGSTVAYSSPVVKVVISEDNHRAVSLHEDGVIDTWSPIDGKTILSANMPTSFIGHTTGAEFVDMAVDQQAGILLSSARLPRSPQEKEIQEKENKEELWQYETCKWDLKSGKMLDRWQEPRRTAAVLSLINEGRFVMYASDRDTVVREARSNGEEIFQYLSKRYGEPIASYFAEENPLRPELIMLVKSDGAINLVDLQQKQEVDTNAEIQDFDSRVLSSGWAPAGDRFFLLIRQGKTDQIHELLFENNKLRFGNRVTLNELQEDLQSIDMKIRSQDGSNTVYVVGLGQKKSEGANSDYRYSRATFPLAGQAAIEQFQPALTEEMLASDALILSDEAVPVPMRAKKTALPPSDRQVLSVRQYGQDAFLASKTGNIYRINTNAQLTPFARTPLISADGDRTANRLITLHEGGIMYRADWMDEKWEWTPLPRVSAAVKEVKVSGDGRQMMLCFSAVQDQGSRIEIVDTESGQPIEVLEKAVTGVWNRSGDLAIVRLDGTVQLRATGMADFANIGALDGEASAENVQSAHFFTEAWLDREPFQWLMVHVQAADGNSKLQYFPLKQFDAEEYIAEKGPYLMDVGDATRVACSPTEGIVVTGHKDSVVVRFASPSLGEYGNEVFRLDGHNGADILSLQFSADGYTLVSTDDRNGLLGWLSRDPLGGGNTPLSIAKPSTVEATPEIQ